MIIMNTHEKPIKSPKFWFHRRKLTIFQIFPSAVVHLEVSLRPWPSSLIFKDESWSHTKARRRPESHRVVSAGKELDMWFSCSTNFGDGVSQQIIDTHTHIYIERERRIGERNAYLHSYTHTDIILQECWHNQTLMMLQNLSFMSVHVQGQNSAT